jgi:hypothetical protein
MHALGMSVLESERENEPSTILEVTRPVVKLCRLVAEETRREIVE